jgi:hypothetical protein
MKKISIYHFVFFLGLGIFLSNASRASAEESANGFSVAPFFQEVELQSGQDSAAFTLEVSNSRDFPVVFRLSVLDFGALDESGGVAFVGSSEDLKNKYGLASWLSLDRDAIVVSPGEKQFIQGRIENKDSLSPGGHYTAIVMKMEDNSEQTIDEKATSKVSVSPTVAALIFTRKVGGEIFGLNLKENNLEDDLFDIPEITKLRFQNTGNVYVTPRGTIKILDPLKREIEKGVINEESALILPETFRVFPVAFKSVALAFLPGKYEVITEYRYDGKDDFIAQKQTLFIFPKITQFILFGLIAVFLIRRVFKARHKLMAKISQ